MFYENDSIVGIYSNGGVLVMEVTDKLWDIVLDDPRNYLDIDNTLDRDKAMDDALIELDMAEEKFTELVNQIPEAFWKRLESTAHMVAIDYF